MKEGWTYKTIGEVIDHLRTGLNPRTHFKLNTPDAEGYYITVRELKGFAIEPDEKTDKVDRAAIKRINERSNLKIGDVLFSGTGTIGKTALVSELPENWNIKEGVYAMTPKHSELDSKYFIYYIGSELFLRLVNDKAAGTGVRSIPMKELVKLPISMPPLSEQQSIVDYLDSAFAKIDTMKANAEKALNEAKALFQASLKEMLEPKEGWEEKTLGEICRDVRYGTSIPSNENGKYKYLRMNNITNDGFLDVSHFKRISLPEKELEKCLVKKGDIIFNRTNSRELVGKSCVFTKDEYMVIAGYLIRIRLKENFEPQFITYNMNMQRSLGLFQHLIVGAVHQANISASNIQKIHINYPSFSEQQSIVATLDSLKSKVDKLQENFDKISKECDALKQSILRDIFE